jgi:CheY-like chemotaxis protein
MSENGSAPSRYPGSVLVVDDDHRFRNILRDFLEWNGFSVAAASSGEEALQYLSRALPKVVLLDIRMPGMDGLMTLKHIRVSHPNLPVICITQVGEDHTQEQAQLLGASDYILKPFHFEELKSVLLLKIFT